MAERKKVPVTSEESFVAFYTDFARAAGLSEAFFAPDLTHDLYSIYACLIEASSRFNLTAITEPSAVAERHILDSLIPAALLDRAGLIKDGDKLCDIGAGAGFPTLPIAAAAKNGAIPCVSVHAIDSTAKKIGHIKDTAEKTGLDKVSAEAGRAEDIAKTKKRESFDVVTARAVSAMPTLIELAAPFVKVGGIFAAMKGHADEEVALAKSAAEKLGFSEAEVTSYALPSGDARTLVVYRKVKSTPAAYPRAYAKIISNPL